MVKKRILLNFLLGICFFVIGAVSCQSRRKKINPPKTDLTIIPEIQENTEFTQMPLGSVKARDWLYNQLRMQADNITGDFEDICPDVASGGNNKSGWLGGSGESWERGPYYVRGLVALAYTLDDKELMEKAQKWIDWAIESQVSSGAFGPYADDLDKLDWWSLMPMLSAIEYYYDATCLTKPDQRVIPFLEKYFEFQMTALRRKPLTSWSIFRAGDNIDSVYWLYQKNGDEKLLELCEKLYSYTLWEDFSERNWEGTYHIVNLHQGLKLFPLMYQVTKESEWLDRYYQSLIWLEARSGRTDGMTNGDEMNQDISSTAGTETCAVAERMLSDEIALRITKDPDVADHLEFIAYNVWPSQLKEDGTGQVYFTMQNQVTATMGNKGFSSDGGDRQVYGAPGGYPCCSCNFHMGWPLFVNSMWMKTGDGGVAAGAYGPNSVNFDTSGGKVTLIQDTDYPFKESINITFKMEGECNFPVYLRIPSWCDSPELYVNGVKQDISAVNGYFALKATWQDGDVIELKFPEDIKAFYGENNSVYIKRGAVLYTLGLKPIVKKSDYNPNNWNLSDKYKTISMTPAGDWNYALYDFNIDDPESFFSVSEKKISSDMRFSFDDAPVKLKGKGVILSDWTLKTNGVADRVPQSPVESAGKKVDITLIPYGFARLRVTHLPWTGEGTVSFDEMEKTGEGAVFYRVTVPAYYDENVKWKYKIEYTLNLEYIASQKGSYRLYINGKDVGVLQMAAGTGNLEVKTTAPEDGMFNIIELKPEEGTLIGYLESCIISVSDMAPDAGLVLEAEEGSVSGTARKGGDHVAGIDEPGSGVTFKGVYINQGGKYRVRVHHAAAMGNATHTFKINGEFAQKVKYNGTPSWSVFSDDVYSEFEIDLEAGKYDFALIKEKTDSSFAEIDKVVLELLT